MNIDLELIAIDQKVKSIVEAGYTRAEAIQMVQAASMIKLTDCIRESYNGKTYLNVAGEIVTYGQ